MIKQYTIIAAVAALSACAPPIPNSGPGVGFDNDLDQARQRQATAARPPSVAGVAGPTSIQPPPPPASVDAFEAAQAQGSTRVDASPGNAAPRIVGSPEISSEQDFETVSAQRSIESDAARIAANREQFKVIEPTALPEVAGAEPNIVDFALRTTHPKGRPIFPRPILIRAGRMDRVCAGFNSDDEAQIAFLDAGGPQRDRLGVDPDGDGYACAWDPAPFRALRSAQGG